MESSKKISEKDKSKRSNAKLNTEIQSFIDETTKIPIHAKNEKNENSKKIEHQNQIPNPLTSGDNLISDLNKIPIDVDLHETKDMEIEEKIRKMNDIKMKSNKFGNGTIETGKMETKKSDTKSDHSKDKQQIDLEYLPSESKELSQISNSKPANLRDNGLKTNNKTTDSTEYNKINTNGNNVEAENKTDLSTPYSYIYKIKPFNQIESNEFIKSFEMQSSAESTLSPQLSQTENDSNSTPSTVSSKI